VIIALGESLIVAGSAAVGLSRSSGFVALAGAGLAVVGLLWWSYFAWFKDDLEEAFAAVEPGERGRVASVAYSLAHFPLVGGIVGFAVAAELMVPHPNDPVDAATIAALGVGLVLYMGATVFAYWRVHRRVLGPRLVLTLATAAGLAFLVDARPVWPLAVAAVGLAVIAAVERDRLPRHVGATHSVSG
jgi:low temperature requirement protein LtrA